MTMDHGRTIRIDLPCATKRARSSPATPARGNGWRQRRPEGLKSRSLVTSSLPNSIWACSDWAATSWENSALCLMVYDATTRRLGLR